MKYKIIKMVGDKIEFTEEELTKLLDDVYEQGYADGSRSRYYYWSTPTVVPTWDNTKITCNSARTKVTG